MTGEAVGPGATPLTMSNGAVSPACSVISSLISIVTPPSQPDPSDHADHLAVGQ